MSHLASINTLPPFVLNAYKIKELCAYSNNKAAILQLTTNASMMFHPLLKPSTYRLVPESCSNTHGLQTDRGRTWAASLNSPKNLE